MKRKPKAKPREWYVVTCEGRPMCGEDELYRSQEDAKFALADAIYRSKRPFTDDPCCKIVMVREVPKKVRGK